MARDESFLPAGFEGIGGIETQVSVLRYGGALRFGARLQTIRRQAIHRRTGGGFMPEDGISEGAITKIELAELAELFDKFEFAFDPRSTSDKEAESDFENQMHRIFEEKIHPSYPRV